MILKFYHFFQIILLVKETIGEPQAYEHNQNCADKCDGIRCFIDCYFKINDDSVGASFEKKIKKAADEQLQKDRLKREDQVLSYSGPTDCGLSYQTNISQLVANEQNLQVVGGKDAEEHEFPWLASIQKKSKKKKIYEHHCGATILNDFWLLSAGHCFAKFMDKISKFKIVVGTNDWTDREDAESYAIKKVVIHEKFNGDTYANDIALVRVKKPIELSKTEGGAYVVNTVCMLSSSTYLPLVGTIAGWGYLDQDAHRPSKTVMKAQVERVDKNKCARNYKEDVKLTDQMICYAAPGKDACKGDSGGPLITTIKERATQFGIISFGKGCADSQHPGVYQDISKYHKWILSVIKN